MFILLSICTTQSFAIAVLEGTLIDKTSKKPVPGATIYVAALAKGTIADDKGYFSLSLPEDEYVISFSAVGYKTQVKQLDIVSNTTMVVEMEEDIKQIQEIVVRGKGIDENVKSVQMSRITLDLVNINKIPLVFGEADIIKAILLQPGISTVGEGAGGFNVRGGRVDQNLVLLDEAPIFNTSHLLGFFTNVNPDAVQEAALYKGNIPAAYGGRLSSLLLMQTKTGNADKLNITGGISTISSRLSVDGPLIKDKLTFLASGRVAYPNLILSLFPKIFNGSRAFFYDGNARLDFRLNDKNRLSLTGYTSYDDFKFPQDTLYGWQTHNATFQWKTLLRSNLAFSFHAIHSHYQFNTKGLQPQYAFLLSSIVRHQELKGQLSYTSGNHRLEAGASAIKYKLDPGSLKPSGDQSNINPFIARKEHALEYSAYISDEWTLSPVITLQAGLRYSAYQSRGPGNVYIYEADVPRREETIIDTVSYNGRKSIKSYGGWEPRVAVKIGLGAATSLKMSYNRTRQYLHLISNTTAISPVDFWKGSDLYVPPQVAEQGAIGIFRNFAGNTYATSVEAYYKTIQNMVEYRNGATLLLNPLLESDLLRAKGKAYGVELLVQKVEGKLTGQVGYTYSRSLTAVQTPFALNQVNGGAYYPSNFDRPHNLTISTQWKTGRGWTMGTNFVYTTGRPATYPDSKYILNNRTIIGYSRRNADRIPDYHRLDVSFSYDTRKVYAETQTTKKHYSVWVFSIYNMYARKNPYSIYFSNDNSRAQAYRLAVFGMFIPSITWNLYF
ncbi:TonB-dependent receptor [Rhodocytophaga aerolata]|uniref:TonB-dependent receptor n=1 Tax=Rhodocytophaga aerolata TaxID=455078 RepID=A0ABT8R584_9BACT|nr:TonB-dependent receptor [Rhodocytophaga aerolata]MDO1447254.1 TonB-dependent receptor [Rhodocytophaga aerolata]